MPDARPTRANRPGQPAHQAREAREAGEGPVPAGAQVGDADLVRLARDGDPVAFRLLVERHQPMARARAARLGADPHEVDDVVQESFLQAFVALDRLRDPDRFAGWLAGIVLNVHRASQRRAPMTLLGEWPEALHPMSADGLPSADDLDRTDALREAVAGLPTGQRQAVAMYYYADQPAGRIAESAGAAKASLHKARRRLREYLTAHRPDLVPIAARRPAMTAVRIARVQPQPGAGPSGFNISEVVVVLTDDAGRRALPIWLSGDDDGEPLWRIRYRQAREADEAGTAGAAGIPAEETAGVPEDAAPEEPPAEALTAELLRAAGATVTGVDVDELGPEVTAARIDLTGPRGTRRVTARLGYGLALAAAAGAPVRVADPVMDRLAVPVEDGGLPGSFPGRRPAPPAVEPPPRRHRFEPRNLDFADGLDRWGFGGSYLSEPSGSHWQDYAITTGDGAAVIAARRSEPYGFAWLAQRIFADDFRGPVVFRAELRTAGVTDRAGLVLKTAEGRLRAGHLGGQMAREEVTGDHGWARHEVTMEITGDTHTISFGVVLHGPGQVEFRHPELLRRP